jgi:nicotinamide-nucleotide amidase
MTIAILATGDEIIVGDTLNTNAHAIAQILSSEGLPVGMHGACSDSDKDIVSALEFLTAQHDIILIMGGLGPTSDDRTRFALANFLKIELVEFTEAILHVETRLNRAGLSMNLGNRQQALFPQGSMLLPNLYGTAMGCYFVHQQKIFVLLPGPPRECLPMFNTYVLPHLRNTQHTSKTIYKWRLFGVAEGEIAQVLDEALEGVDCETGYRIDMPYVEFKVRCIPKYEQHVRTIIEPLVAPYIIASPEYKASDRLRERLEHLNEPVLVIDEATGGVLQTLLQKPSNHSLIHFHDHPGCNIKFYISGLEAYWQLPFRSSFVVDYAAEWLSFRLFHLIDQLH